MVPNVTALCLIGGLAVVIAPVYPFSGWRGLARNVAVSLTVAYLLAGIGVVLGSVMHAAIFGEPVLID